MSDIHVKFNHGGVHIPEEVVRDAANMYLSMSAQHLYDLLDGQNLEKVIQDLMKSNDFLQFVGYIYDCGKEDG